MENTTKLLICDENDEERAKLIECLHKSGYKCDEAKDGISAVTKITSQKYDAVIVDLWISKLDGIGIIRKAKTSLESCPAFILMSPINRQSILLEASEAGADLCIPKPYDFSSLILHIESIIKSKNRTSDRQNDIMPDMEAQVTKIIHQIGVPAHIKGYQYLREAIKLAVEDIDRIHDMTAYIYNPIALADNTTAKCVRGAISRAIEIGWDRGDLDTLQQYFGFPVSNTKGKPTNAECIALLADKILLSYERTQ
jgi:two-component system response regulator (stage 0 sporulation protein A)